VFGNFFEIAGQHSHNFVDTGALVLGEPGYRGPRGLLKFLEQFDRQAGEIVDEIQRVLDLVSNAGGRLAERGHLLRLNEPVLGRPQPGQCRLRRLLSLFQFTVALFKVRDIGVDGHQRSVLGRVIADLEPRAAAQMLDARTASASASQQRGQPCLGIAADIKEHAASEASAHEVLEFHARNELHSGKLTEKLGIT
jgi:hypothetical protein